jgi:DNA-binding IclR family transcriptional regulator
LSAPQRPARPTARAASAATTAAAASAAASATATSTARTTAPAASIDPKPDAKAQRAVQSVEVGGRLLLALGAAPGPMSLKDLAAAAGLPAARAHPYLVSFGKLRLIEQQGVSGHYALGAAALQLGLTCLHQLDPVRAATPVAEELARSSGHAVALAVWGNFGPTIVRMIDARQPLHVAMRAGTVMSLLGTATGRAFAAALPDARLALALAGPLGEQPVDPKADPTADHTADELRRPHYTAAQAHTLAEIRAEAARHGGLARAVGRPIPGVNAFSAAAYDHEGQAAIVITTLGHQDNFSPRWDAAPAQGVRRAADEISHRLGWRGAPTMPAAAGSAAAPDDESAG